MQPGNQKQRKKQSKAFWKRHIKKCSESGLTQKEYCFRNGLGVKSMAYWKSKLKKEETEVSFVHLPISVRSASTTQASLKLICNEKYRVEVGDHFSVDTLKRLLNTIETL